METRLGDLLGHQTTTELHAPFQQQNVQALLLQVAGQHQAVLARADDDAVEGVLHDFAACRSSATIRRVAARVAPAALR
jgi:hypothetical protein